MKQYLEMMRHVRENGVYKSDRTGTGTYSVFGYQMRFDLSDGSFPLVTTKQCHLKSIIHELLWFLKGETNIRYLKENGVSIWDEWVLPGTEEYRDMDVQRMQELLRTHFLKKEGYETCSFVYRPASDELTDTPTHGQCQMYIKGKDITISVLDHPEVDEEEELRVFFREVLKREAKDLIAGELGPVYGSQWRNWPVAQQSTVDALIELSCLGNGNRWGNSDGNCIAQKALLDIPGIVHNKKAYMSSGYSYEDWVKLTTREKGITSTRGGIDQITQLVNSLKGNPDSRRHIVTAWNPLEVDFMTLPPCHCLYQFYTSPMVGMERWVYGLNHGYFEENEGRGQFGLDEFLDQKGVPTRKLSCQLYQRKSHCAFVA